MGAGGFARMMGIRLGTLRGICQKYSSLLPLDLPFVTPRTLVMKRSVLLTTKCPVLGTQLDT